MDIDFLVAVPLLVVYRRVARAKRTRLHSQLTAASAPTSSSSKASRTASTLSALASSSATVAVALS